MSEPVVKDKNAPSGSVLLKSKYGQEYQCSFPDPLEQDRQKEEGEKAALETGVVELLKPLEKGPCLFKTKDWWSYELCFGSHVKQYHLEDNIIKGEVVTLGMFSHDFDWDNETNKEQRIRSKSGLNRYHSRYYVNGTKCDLTGLPRKTEVRFVCEDVGSDFIARVDEPETCSYIMTVHTRLICQHPYLKPLSRPKPVPITCSPLLTPHQYQMYHSRRAEIDEVNEEIRRQSENLKMVRSQIDKDITLGSRAVMLGSSDDWEDVFKARVSQAHLNLRDMLDSVSDGQTEETRPPAKDDTEQSDKAVPEDEDASESAPEADDVLDEDDLLDDEEGELKDLSQSKAQQEKVLETVEKGLDNLEKTKTLLDQTLDLQKKNALKDLTESLVKLLNKLETSQKKIDAVDKKIENIVGKMEAKGDTGEDLDEAVEDVETTTATPGTDDSRGDSTADSSATPKGPDTSGLEDRLQVRVRKLSGKEAEAARAADSPGLSNSQRSDLERSVKEGLEKAGLDTKNQKIHVRIVTAGFIDKDDESITILSGEDTAAFQNMIVAILGGGGGEASREQKRYEQMEENYRLVFGKQQSSQDSQSSDPPQAGQESAAPSTESQGRSQDSDVQEE